MNKEIMEFVRKYKDCEETTTPMPGEFTEKISILSIIITVNIYRIYHHREGKTMNKEQEQQLVDYYSATDKYIKSALHSQAHQSVFTKESDKYQWLVLEEKSQNQVEVRQTDNHGTITARDNYELTRNIPKCMGMERLCRDVNMQIPFNADEINLIYQFGEQEKSETCANLSAILPQAKDSDTKQIINSTLKKLNALSEETCAELTATTKRRKITERDHSIRIRLAKAKEQPKQPAVTEQKKHRTNSRGDMKL